MKGNDEKSESMKRDNLSLPPFKYTFCLKQILFLILVFPSSSARILKNEGMKGMKQDVEQVCEEGERMKMIICFQAINY